MLGYTDLNVIEDMILVMQKLVPLEVRQVMCALLLGKVRTGKKKEWQGWSFFYDDDEVVWA